MASLDIEKRKDQDKFFYQLSFFSSRLKADQIGAISLRAKKHVYIVKTLRDEDKASKITKNKIPK